MKITTIRGEQIDLTPGVKLEGALLRDLDLAGIDLHGSVLRDCYFNESSLRGANLRDCDLRGAVFYRTDLRGADLRGAVLDDECYWKEAIFDDSLQWPSGGTAETQFTESERHAIRLNDSFNQRSYYLGGLCSPNLIPRNELFGIFKIRKLTLEEEIQEIEAVYEPSFSFVPPELEGKILPLSSEENAALFQQLALNIFVAFKYVSHDGEFDIMDELRVFDTNADLTDGSHTKGNKKCVHDAVLYTHACQILIALGLRFERIVDTKYVVASMRPTWDMRAFTASEPFRLFEALYDYEINGCDSEVLDVGELLSFAPTIWHQDAFAPAHAVLKEAAKLIADKTSGTRGKIPKKGEIDPLQATMASLLAYFHVAALPADPDLGRVLFEDLTVHWIEDLVFELLGIEEAVWVEDGVITVKMNPPMDVQDVLEIHNIMDVSDDGLPDLGVAWPSLGIFRHFLP